MAGAEQSLGTRWVRSPLRKRFVKDGPREVGAGVAQAGGAREGCAPGMRPVAARGAGSWPPGPLHTRPRALLSAPDL